MKTPSNLTDAEWDVIHVLWNEDEPCTAGRVQEALASSRGWAYSTVKTTLDRMVAKHLLTVTQEGKRHLFSPAVSASTTRFSELKHFLGQAFGGAFSPALQLLIEEEGLSPGELATLQRMIEEASND